jgi:NAD(P)H-dependent FMN reductase
MLRIAVVIGSTRPNRNGAAVASWVVDVGTQIDAPLEIVDLGDVGLPLLDESDPAALSSGYFHAHTRRWAEIVSRYDGFVFVAPEYNHSLPAALKNALDFLYSEWNTKAAGLVTYGTHGGVRAAEHLRLVCAELQMATVRTQVALSLFDDFEDVCRFAPRDHQLAVVLRLVDEVIAWSGALKELRQLDSHLVASATVTCRRRRWWGNNLTPLGRHAGGDTRQPLRLRRQLLQLTGQPRSLRPDRDLGVEPSAQLRRFRRDRSPEHSVVRQDAASNTEQPRPNAGAGDLVKAAPRDKKVPPRCRRRLPAGPRGEGRRQGSARSCRRREPETALRDLPLFSTRTPVGECSPALPTTYMPGSRWIVSRTPNALEFESCSVDHVGLPVRFVAGWRRSSVRPAPQVGEPMTWSPEDAGTPPRSAQGCRTGTDTQGAAASTRARDANGV